MRKQAIFGIAAMLLLVAVTVLLNISGGDSGTAAGSGRAKQEESDAGPSADADDTGEASDGAGLLALVERIDTGAETMLLLDLSSGTAFSYRYTGSTDIRNKYGKVITAGSLTTGDIVEVKYDVENERLDSVYISGDAWEYKNVTNMKIDESIGKITIGDAIYRYTDVLRIINGDIYQDFADICSTDEFHVRGTGNQVYALIVSRGHGYLRLQDDEEFIGGTVYVGLSKTAQVTEDMLLTVPEGEYEVRVEKGELGGTRTVRISRDEVSVFPLGEFGTQPVQLGRVHFRLDPADSELYIDGMKAYSVDGAELSYGVHQIEVMLGGYVTYKGSIEVTRTEHTYQVTLMANEQPEEDEEEDSLEADGENDEIDPWWEADDEASGSLDWGEATASPEADSSDDWVSTAGDGRIPDSTSDDDSDEELPTEAPEEPVEAQDREGGGETGTPTSGEGQDGDDDGETGTPTPGEGQDGDDDGEKGTPTPGEEQAGETGTPMPGEGQADSEKNTDADGNSIVIECTEGTAVYINGTRMGIIEGGQLRLPKCTGNLTIMLELDGCENKTYTIAVEDDGRDAVFKFPSMN